MNLKKGYIIISIFLSICLSCSGGSGFSLTSSAKIEIKEMCSLLAIGSTEEFKARLLTKSEFEKYVYPVLPEARQKKPVPADDYWLISIIDPQRSIDKFYFIFKESQKIKFIKLGKALKKKNFGNVTIYNNIPVFFSGNNNEKQFTNLISAVVCFEDQCKIWVLDRED